MTTRDTVVETADGPINVVTWYGETDPILAVHGVSSTSRLWSWLHDNAPWATLVAPDLPGRGLSPARHASSVQIQADGLVALLDALGIVTADVVGMSLGGFIAIEMAARHPDRVRSVVLLDGGLPMPTPLPGEALTGALRDQYGDSTTWTDVTAYARHYVAAAPLVDVTDPRLLDALAHDLADGTCGGAVRRDLDTVVQDAVSVLGSERPAAALAEVRAPMWLAHAEWAAGAGTEPMYPADHVASIAARTPNLVHTELVEGVDHAAIVMTDRGAQRCTQLLEKVVRR